MQRLLCLFAAALAVSVAGAGRAAAAAPLPPLLPAAAATYTTIDVPGADWTNVNGIARTGVLGRSVELVGAFHDLAGTHGFVLAGGHWTTLDVPVPNARDTEAFGVNSLNEVVGTYDLPGQNGTTLTCGFLYSGGRFTQPFSDQNCTFWPYGIDSGGIVAGSTTKGWIVLHGFAAPLGTLPQTLYDVPQAFATEIWGVNNKPTPEMVGSFVDSNFRSHGVLFLPTDVAFDVPGTTGGTIGKGINDTGSIVGTYDAGTDATGMYGDHGFVDDSGHFRDIDFPGADRTVANGIDDVNPLTATNYDVVGSYETVDRFGTTHVHGFMAQVAPPPTSR